MKIAGRALTVGGFVVGIIQWNARRAEAGVVRATIDATPLGDVVQIVVDYSEIRDALDAITKAHEAVSQGEALTARLRASLARNMALSAYQRISKDIMVTNPDYIDLKQIGIALQSYQDQAHSLYYLYMNDKISETTYQQRLKDLDAKLRQDLIDAANQPASGGSTGPTT